MSGRRRRPATLAALLVTLVLAGCTAGGATQAPQVTPATAPPATSHPTPIPSTATSWGPILDAVPATFPRYPGARETTPAEPASLALVTGDSVATVSGWYDRALRGLGYASSGPSAPAEDGSVVEAFDGSGVAAGCRVQVSHRPQGTETLVVVLYGASCPAK